MLETLSIRNLALIENTELEFSPGFNVITGESGAGKSILLGGLALLTGERAESSRIRTGESRAEVSAVFSVPPEHRQELKTLLAEWDVDASCDTLTLRRVLTASSSRNYLNGSPVPLKQIQEAASLLLDMQKADDQLSLNSPVRQLALLDEYAGSAALQERCRLCAAALHETERAQREFRSSLISGAELELAQELVQAVGALNPEEGEDERLVEAQQRSGASAELLQLSQAAAGLIAESENSLADHAAALNRLLLQMSHYDEKGTAGLVTAGELLSEQLRDLTDSLERYASSIELDPEAFAALEARLSSLQALKRRYGPMLGQVLERYRTCVAQLEARGNAAARLQEMEQKIAACRKDLTDACEALTAKRKEAAKALEKALQTPLQAVGFTKSRFSAAFSSVELGENGADAIDFLFSANAGEELRFLRLIASSGERSRLFLALKTVLADADRTPTSVFDEIDVNIGGETANKVGALLRSLGRSHQVICISHLAQVSAGADRHFAVAKHEEKGRTISIARVLQGEEIIGELARMLGGGVEAARHAKSILDRNTQDASC